jgi:hypothetical protein
MTNDYISGVLMGFGLDLISTGLWLKYTKNIMVVNDKHWFFE